MSKRYLEDSNWVTRSGMKVKFGLATEFSLHGKIHVIGVLLTDTIEIPTIWEGMSLNHLTDSRLDLVTREREFKG